MTATKLMQPYLYRDGEWEALDPNYGDYTFDLWNGSPDDDVTLFGHEDGGNRRVTLEVSDGFTSVDAPRDELIKYHTRYSAAYKWSYSHALLYGSPRTPHDPYVTVLEIAEDAHKDPEYEKDYGPVSPYPYLVHVNLGFTTHTVFADGFPDLTRLLGEVLPLIGNPPPRNAEIYGLHKWAASWGEFPIE
jgi:hypothetical protein